ncbi:MAG: hypothetical protein H7239_12635 [Flavobacterium sp.]|nr:hypothetical protein [Flavobacterium sp.]
MKSKNILSVHHSGSGHEIQKNKLQRLSKKSIVIFAIVLGSIFTSFKTATQKDSGAKQNITEAKQDLQETKVDNANEWLKFKADSQAKILDNEKRIADLKVKMKKPGNTFDGLYRTRIEKLEAKNSELKSKLNNYDGNQTEWKTFKSDFNLDMKEIGNNIKNLFR